MKKNNILNSIIFISFISMTITSCGGEYIRCKHIIIPGYKEDTFNDGEVQNLELYRYCSKTSNNRILLNNRVGYENVKRDYPIRYYDRNNEQFEEYLFDKYIGKAQIFSELYLNKSTREVLINYKACECESYDDNSSLEQNKLAFEELINSNFYYFNSNNYEYAGGTSYYYKIVDTVDFKGTDHTEIISISKDDEYYYVLY